MFGTLILEEFECQLCFFGESKTKLEMKYNLWRSLEGRPRQMWVGDWGEDSTEICGSDFGEDQHRVEQRIPAEFRPGLQQLRLGFLCQPLIGASFSPALLFYYLFMFIIMFLPFWSGFLLRFYCSRRVRQINFPLAVAF